MTSQKTYQVRVKEGDIYRVIGNNLTEEEKNLYVKLYRATYPDLEVIELKNT